MCDSANKRKKHSHRCPTCGNGVYCYKGGCTLPQRTECVGCRWRKQRAADVGRTVRIKPGFGFWRTDSYPIGGCFDRAGSEGLVVQITRTFPDYRGCTCEGITAERQKVAFSLSDAVDAA